MKQIPRSQLTYVLDPQAPSVARVVPGERFLVETHDCRTGTITSESQTDQLPDLRWVNPATGPIVVDGAEPGDVLRVEIHDVRVGAQGLMIVRPGVTAFPDVLEPHIRIVPIEGSEAVVGPFRVPVSPMVGVVGVAPAVDPVRATLGGAHGGNVDTKLIAAGAAVYLPVLVPGAKLYFGDLHAAMGDGEVFLTGIEIQGEVEATVTLLRESTVPTPLVETATVLATVAEGPTLDEASRKALAMARDLLVLLTGANAIDAGFLLSAACDLRVSQFLPGASIHARVEIPKSVLAASGYGTDPKALVPRPA